MTTQNSNPKPIPAKEDRAPWYVALARILLYLFLCLLGFLPIGRLAMFIVYMLGNLGGLTLNDTVVLAWAAQHPVAATVIVIAAYISFVIHFTGIIGGDIRRKIKAELDAAEQ